MANHNTLRYQLRKQLHKLQQRLERLENHQRNKGYEPSRDTEERALELENEDVVEALIPKTLDEIRAVRRALSRIDVGLDVECRRCGVPIDPRRLAILPQADTCSRCAAGMPIERRI